MALVRLVMKLNQKQASSLFNGNRYNGAKVTLFTAFATILGMTPKLAWLLAEQAITDYTKANANGQANVKFGVTSKGNLNVTDMFKAKMGASEAMQIAHFVQWFGEAGKHGGKYNTASIELVNPLAEYAAKLESECSPELAASITAKYDAAVEAAKAETAEQVAA